MQVLLLSRDLLVQSQVQGLAGRAGAHVAIAGDGATTLAECITREVDLVVVDLSTPQLDIAELAGALRQNLPRLKILAFAPHVHQARLDAAQAAGCDQVVSRGKLEWALQRALAAEVQQRDAGTHE